MVQIMAAVAAYAYILLVRQVFSERVFEPRFGGATDEVEFQAGLTLSHGVLRALEDLASGDVYLVGPEPTLADFHHAAMIDYFVMAPEGRAALAQWPKLRAWWAGLRNRPSIRGTDLFSS